MGPKGDRAKSKRLRRFLKFLKKSCYSRFIHRRKSLMKARVPSGLGTSASMALRRACSRYSHHAGAPVCMDYKDAKFQDPL